MNAPQPAPYNSPSPSDGRAVGQNATDVLPPSAIPDYELIRRIGGGAYGEVWLARSATGVLRALKIVHRSTFKDDRPFQREFEGIQRFEKISREHPGQLALFHVGRNEAEGYFYYVMELADHAMVAADVRRLTSPESETHLPKAEIKSEPPDVGCYTPHTLRAELEQGRLPAARVLEIGLALTEALAHLHSHGLVHRDVKPSNVIFVNGRPKLADIGLVTDAGDTRSIVGTEGYLPPDGPGTPQADIFALGKVLYETLTGLDRRQFPELPEEFHARPDAKLAFELNEVILKACESDSRQRYQSAEQMRADLELLRVGRSVKRHHAWQRNLNRTKKLAMTIGAFAIVSLIGYQLVVRSARPSAIMWSKNAEANEAYRIGNLAFQQDDADSLEKAAKYFSHAIDLDPNFARAYGRLAITYVWMGASDPETLKKARQFAEKALSLDPSLADAHHALGAVKGLLEHDWIGHEKECREAIRLDPNSEENFYNYASFLSLVGRTNEALRQLEIALKFDSHSIRSLQWAGFVFGRTRQYDQVIKKTEELIERVPSNRANLTALFLVPAYRETGKYTKAIELEASCDPLLAAQPDRVKALQAAFNEGGSRGYWKQRLDWYEASNDESNPVQLALLHARVGDKERAFHFLDQAAEKTPVQLCFVISTEPGFDNLRSDPHFATVLTRFGLGRKSQK